MFFHSKGRGGKGGKGEIWLIWEGYGGRNGNILPRDNGGDNFLFGFKIPFHLPKKLSFFSHITGIKGKGVNRKIRDSFFPGKGEKWE